MDISAILTNRINFFTPKASSPAAPPKEVKADTFEPSAPFEYIGKDIIEKTSLEMLKDFGFNHSETRYLIKMAQKINGTPFFGSGLLLMIDHQQEFNFQNPKQLVVFTILNNTANEYKNELAKFSRNDDYVNAFLEITNIEKDDSIDSIYTSQEAQDVYKLILKTGKNKKQLEAMVNLYKEAHKVIPRQCFLYKDWVVRVGEYISDNNNFKAYRKRQQALKDNKEIPKQSIAIGPRISISV